VDVIGRILTDAPVERFAWPSRLRCQQAVRLSKTS
jgi:hypothetical protein